MTNTSQDWWARLLDRDVVRRAVMDTGAFLLAFAVFEQHLIERPRGFLGMAGGPYQSKRDHLLAEGDLRRRRPQLRAAALSWFEDLGAIDGDDARVFERARLLRNRVAHESFDPLLEDLAGDLAASTADLRRLLAQMDLWWIREIEAQIQPDTFGSPDEIHNATSLAAVALNHVLRCLTETAPGHQDSGSPSA